MLRNELTVVELSSKNNILELSFNVWLDIKPPPGQSVIPSLAPEPLDPAAPTPNIHRHIGNRSVESQCAILSKQQQGELLYVPKSSLRQEKNPLSVDPRRVRIRGVSSTPSPPSGQASFTFASLTIVVREEDLSNPSSSGRIGSPSQLAPS